MVVAGDLTLFLDLGSFSVETDTSLIAQLPQEEAALYECLRLRSRDISAYVVDGDFSFHALEQSGGSEALEVGWLPLSDFLACTHASYAAYLQELHCFEIKQSLVSDNQRTASMGYSMSFQPSLIVLGKKR